MTIQIIDPLTDSRWSDLAARHPRATAFHQTGWLKALADTYGYRPIALTSASAGEPLRDGMVLCHIASWITGHRLVSLPFADHCEPLLDGPAALEDFVIRLRQERILQRCKYLELRLRTDFQDAHGLQQSDSYWFHELDVTPPLERIFKALHKDSIQRKIRRAEKEQLVYEAGRSELLAEEFYRLLLVTRKRHQLPPQPRIWFSTLVNCMGDGIRIRVARKNGVAIAAMLTLRHRAGVIYKYGCSDAAFHQLGGMPFLFWKLIKESHATGAETIDFGRSSLTNNGLVAFKDKFGTAKTLLKYYRDPSVKTKDEAYRDSSTTRQIFSILPDALMSLAGRMLYRHIG